MKVRFFNPGLGFKNIKTEVMSEIERVLDAGDLILRGDVEKFEENVCNFTGAKYCVALNSCTDALYLALRYLKIGPGDEVLVPSRTFVASAQVIVQCGATPVYYDIDGMTSLPFSDKIKAIIPVHIEGAFDSQFQDVLDAAERHGWHVIEDSAQAFGAVWHDERSAGVIESKRAGTIGLAGCYSFYPAKTLGAYGDAGALVTNDEDLYKWVKEARNHFKNDAADWGINSRLDNVQAAILNVKFKYYDRALARRREIADMYLVNLPVEIEAPEDSYGRIWQDFIVRCDSKEQRDNLYAFLKENGVETMKNNYPFPVAKLPGAQKYEDETLRLPCNELLTDEEVAYVIECVKKFYV